MLHMSLRFAAALNISHKRITTATVTVPGGVPVAVDFEPGATISAASTIGPRRTASVSLAPQPGVNLYEIVSTPGALFDIFHGIDFGAGDRELIQVFHGEAASGGVNIIDGQISLTLVDMWVRLERCRLPYPYTLSPGYRPAIISARVTDAMPGTTVLQLAPNGPLISTGLWDTDRTQVIKDLANDGSLDCYFDPTGTFIIRPEPIIMPSAPVWTYTTGVVGNLEAASRTRPFDRLYNSVVVKPIDDTQTWAQQTVTISDPNNPRHPDKIGVVPFYYSSPTILNVGQALSTANTFLQRVQGTTETLSIDALGNPAQEIGDTVAVQHPATDTDPGFAAAHLVDGFTLQLDTGGMDVATRSTDIADVEES